jgi:hypothetical protein
LHRVTTIVHMRGVGINYHDLFAQVRDSCYPTGTQHGFDIVRHVFGGDNANGVEWALQKGLPRPHGVLIPTTINT